MQHLMQKYEEEKRKLNELGQRSLEQGIPLSGNEAVQAQSRRVDELINQMHLEKNGYSEAFRLNFCLGGDVVSFPVWFVQTIQGRLNEVTAQIEYQSESRHAFEEESKAFQALFDSMDIARMPEFEYWEDKLQLKQSALNERLYLQGLKDGMQLANAFTAPSILSD
ncbi:hypothetical protein HQN87_23885 [Paenibacillus tritici]|uniref:Uncharacterized protein n=1 Tax=Paenibacillus tritici TaxID=1873425 RepID=A0ABX2DUK5_9BACL|nr:MULTISPECIES: hypothetical protein [Paenibacillus]AIQ15885.1 hypothetical protein H70357_03620 [Paenibacillus sp. FSL H7-0357]KHL91640.1 hypothetical protein QW71_33515 [Paenibacillus sp. IHB B 3415]NQX48375.1 hypothetical protein [Paenibacillus tritici]